MTAYRFVLNCTPTAQARVRHAVRCGHSVAYKSAGQKSAEAVLDDLLLARAPKKPLEGPLVLEFIAGMRYPHRPRKSNERPCYAARSPIRRSRTSTTWRSSSRTLCPAPGSGATTGRWCPCVARNATPLSRTGRWLCTPLEVVHEYGRTG